MRIDFREERRFKMTLAYELSTAVLEWHAARSTHERLEKGICVLWKPLPQTTEPMDVANDLVDAESIGSSYDAADPVNDDESDTEFEQEAEPLQPQTLENHVGPSTGPDKKENSPHTNELANSKEIADMESVEGPQAENVQSANMDAMEIEKPRTDEPASSSKPAPSTGGDAYPTGTAVRAATKSNVYASLRNIVAYSKPAALFFDPFTIQGSDTTPDISNVSNLTAIFPDLHIFNMLDVVPPTLSNSHDGKKRFETRKSDRDDPYKRSEDTAYTKLHPSGSFMLNKVTLLGPLRPSKNWGKDHWKPLQESVTTAETENPTRISEESTNGLFCSHVMFNSHSSINEELFDPRSNHSPLVLLAMQLHALSAKQEKEVRKRPLMRHWSTSEDALLKHLIDKYQTNWALIAECFNSSRLSFSTDKRTPRDCLERWREKWGPDARRLDGAGTTEDPSSSNQITTRGVKRLASVSVASSGLGSSDASQGFESRKRRRHVFLQETIRKAGKKRAEIVARQQG